jgi:hypothetical protein
MTQEIKDLQEINDHLIWWKNFHQKEIERLQNINEALSMALRDIYTDYASYYPSSVNNSFAMKAAREILKEQYK